MARVDLAGLRARIRAIEGGGVARKAAVALGDPALDRALPWGGLPLRALHEIGGHMGAAPAFAAALLARFGEGPGALLWCQSRQGERRFGRLYGPGLAAFGIDAGRLILVRAWREREVLVAMEEALRSGAVSAVVGEVDGLDLRASRRLQLAAEAGGGAGLVLRLGRDSGGANAALTRWRIWPLPGGAIDGRFRLAWRAELWRCRGGVPGHFAVLWDEQTLRFALAAGLADRPHAAFGQALRAG